MNFHELPKFLLSKGYSKQDIIDSGAVNEADGRLTDAQGGRLVFPVINAMDEVVAFGGRILKKTDFAKYKNTKETILFNKSKTLYNINLLKKLRKTQTIKEVIMVEGYMDTISLYQAGFKNVVASMGTSLTQEQARLIKRYADTVLISYDGDGAGQKANMRGLEILKGEGVNVKVVPLPDGLDPDDVIKQRGEEGYKKCLGSAMPLIDYKLNVLGRGFDLTKTEDKRKYATEALNIVRTVESAAEQDILLKQLRDTTGITYEYLSRELTSKPQTVKTVKDEVKRKDDSTKIEKASRFVIACYLFGAKYAEGDATKIPFCNEVHEIIANYIKSKYLLEERIQPAELFEFFEEDGKENAELNFIFDLNDGNKLAGEVNEKYFNDCVRQLKINRINSQIDVLKAGAQKENEISKKLSIASEIQKLLKQKEKIKSGE